jgi:CDP-glycerol glycerophosphotransferase
MHKKIIRLIGTLLSKIVPKSKNILLFVGTSELRYNENTRYLFEYLLKHNPEYSLYWVSMSSKIDCHIKKMGGKALNPKKISSIPILLRARAIFGTGQSVYNPAGLLSSKKTLKINIYHASGIRQTNAGWDDYPNEKKIRNYMSGPDIVTHINQWDFVNFTSQFTETYMGKINFLLPRSKRIRLGYPRNDHLFNLRPKQNTTRKKIVLYAPTWRMNQPELWFPLEKMNGFDFQKFDTFLESQNCEMLVSLHPHCKINNFPKSINSIKIIDTSQDELFDINQLLVDVDALITDYSSVATDFLITSKPVIFSFIDYDVFLNERGLLLDIREKLPGYAAENYEALQDSLKKICSENISNITAENINNYMEKFYEPNLNNSCQRWVNFLKNTL